MIIYGDAIIDNASSTYVVSYDGVEVSRNELYLLAYADLTWKGLDIPEEDCHWIIVKTINKIGVKGAEVIETVGEFETMKEFQMYLRKEIRIVKEN